VFGETIELLYSWRILIQGYVMGNFADEGDKFSRNVAGNLIK
jgi:hypothetical protein